MQSCLHMTWVGGEWLRNKRAWWCERKRKLFQSKLLHSDLTFFFFFFLKMHQCWWITPNKTKNVLIKERFNVDFKENYHRNWRKVVCEELERPKELLISHSKVHWLSLPLQLRTFKVMRNKTNSSVCVRLCICSYISVSRHINTSDIINFLPRQNLSEASRWN